MTLTLRTPGRLTSKEEFESGNDWVGIDDAVKVFEGTVDFTIGDFTTINFANKFNYNGVDNLVLIVKDKTGSYVGAQYFAAYATPTKQQCLSIYNDGTGEYDLSNLSSYSGSRMFLKNQLKLDIDYGAIPGNSTVNNYRVPTNTYVPYELSQQIYTKEELAWAGDITSISFYNIRLQSTRNLNIYLMPTYVTEFADGNSWVPFTESNRYFSGEVTFFENDWTTITFDRPFSYNGKTNVVLVVADNTGTDDAPDFMEFKMFSTSTYQALYYFDYDGGLPAGIENAEGLTAKTGNTISSKAQIKLNLPAPDTSTMPANFLVEPTSDGAAVTWSGEADYWTVKYRVYNYSTAYTTTTVYSPQYTITGLPSNKEYYVCVQANFDDGTSSKWVGERFKTTFPVPQDLVAESHTPTSVDISWTGIGSGDYHVQYFNPANFEPVIFEDFETVQVDDAPQTFVDRGWTRMSSAPGWYDLKVNTFSGIVSPVSYSKLSGTDYTANNWLISPQIEIKGTLSFWVYANAGDQYEVKLSDSGNNVEDFVYTIQSMKAASSGWNEVRIDLSAYEGMQGYIGIHHSDASKGMLAFDDFCVFTGDMNYAYASSSEVTIEGLEPGTEYQYRVFAHKSGDISGCTDYETFTVLEKNPKPYELELVKAHLDKAQVQWQGFSDTYKVEYREAEQTFYKPFSFFEDFENGLEEKGWTVYTNGDAPTYYSEDGWFVTHNASYYSEEVGKMVTARSWTTGEGALNADNWLISPIVDLKGELRFMQRANDSWPDNYEVLLSTTGTAIEDFTTTLREMAPALSGSDRWEEVVIDLSDYEGQQGYIAIHHKDYDALYLAIDNFSIGTLKVDHSIPAGEWQLAGEDIATNTFMIEGLKKATKYDYRVTGVKEGEEDAVSEPASFTTITPVDLVLDVKSNDNSTEIYYCNDKYANVTLKGRTIKKDDRWWSIFLPFDLELEGSILEGAEIRSLEGTPTEFDNFLVLDCLTPLAKIEAGRPYLIRFDKGEDIVDPVFEDVIVQYTSKDTYLEGSTVLFGGLYDYCPNVSEDYYYVFDGNIRLGHLNLQTNQALDGFSCYVWISTSLNDGKEGIGLNFDGDLMNVWTGIGNVEKTEQPTTIYNVAGQRLGKMQKGINIVGNKKVLKK